MAGFRGCQWQLLLASVHLQVPRVTAWDTTWATCGACACRRMASASVATPHALAMQPSAEQALASTERSPGLLAAAAGMDTCMSRGCEAPMQARTSRYLAPAVAALARALACVWSAASDGEGGKGHSDSANV